MAITVECTKCKNELDRPGGLAFSPPSFHASVSKIHLCSDCWQKFVGWLYDLKN